MAKVSVVAAPSAVRDRRIAYLLGRLAVGVSLFGHGLVRLPELGAFHDELRGQFATSLIPTELVSLAGYAIPVVELVLGVTITLGILTRLSLIGGAAEMVALIFGSTTIQNWTSIGDQLLHAIPLVVLLAFAEFNTYSVDRLVLRRGAPAPQTA